MILSFSVVEYRKVYCPTVYFIRFFEGEVHNKRENYITTMSQITTI
jgi:hypothetical protein